MTGMFSMLGLMMFASAHGSSHRYELEFSEDAKSVTVTAKLADGVRQLHAQDGNAAELRGLSNCDGVLIRGQRGGRMTLPKGTRCIRYSATLPQEKQRQGMPWNRYSANQVTVSSPSSFLFLPGLKSDDRVHITVNTTHPLSVPWAEHGDGYVITASPGSSTGLIVLGAFHEIDLSHTSLRKPAIFVGDRRQKKKVTAWLEAAVSAVSAVGDRFPNPQAQVLVFDVGTSGASPVPFGYVIRDQGEAVRFFVDASRTLADLQFDWTASHEFSHLLLPYVRSRQKWISEGFASYYQNVLQTRRGQYGEAEGWRRLVRSFASAQRQGDDMSPNGTANRDFWQARMMIYWSGAAMALHADVMLRDRSGGSQSLDAVLGRLSSCCLPSAGDWTGVDLFQKLDELGGAGVFMEVYNKFANRRGMPPTRALFQRLGVTVAGDTVHLDNTAELAQIRRAIMGAA